MAPAHRSTFLELPGEIRELVYDKVLSPADNLKDLGDGYKRYSYDLALFRVCQQVYFEARQVFRRDNIFVCIETPWEKAQQHVKERGFVPIIVSGDKADRFTSYHLKVIINKPASHEPQRFTILLDDLPLFCKMWFYSSLGFPGLNRHLRLTLELQDPYSPSFEHRTIPKAVQQRLVMPFGIVKGLSEVDVRGECYDSVQRTLKEEMAVPNKSPEQCLEEATKLKDAGNEALTKTQYLAAIRLYEESFLAMHIVCKGRSRWVWADAFFQKELQGGTFDKQHGHMVRMVLRIRLVANMVLAFLKLGNSQEAYFWGKRSIDIMKESTGTDEPMTGFVAAKELGKIYYRTGLACKELGYNIEARQFIKVAAAYLPNDAIVGKELAAVAPRLG